MENNFDQNKIQQPQAKIPPSSKKINKAYLIAVFMVLSLVFTILSGAVAKESSSCEAPEFNYYATVSYAGFPFQFLHNNDVNTAGNLKGVFLHCANVENAFYGKWFVLDIVAWFIFIVIIYYLFLFVMKSAKRSHLN